MVIRNILSINHHLICRGENEDHLPTKNKANNRKFFYFILYDQNVNYKHPYLL